MTICNEIEENIMLYIEDELPQDVLGSYTKHINECGSCKKIYLKYLKMDTNLHIHGRNSTEFKNILKSSEDHPNRNTSISEEGEKFADKDTETIKEMCLKYLDKEALETTTFEKSWDSYLSKPTNERKNLSIQDSEQYQDAAFMSDDKEPTVEDLMIILFSNVYWELNNQTSKNLSKYFYRKKWISSQVESVGTITPYRKELLKDMLEWLIENFYPYKTQ